jgi:hypothetical protein
MVTIDFRVLTCVVLATGLVSIPQARAQGGPTPPTAPGYANASNNPGKVGVAMTIRSEASCEIGHGNPIAIVEINAPNGGYYQYSYTLDNQNGVTFTPPVAGTYSVTSYVNPQTATCYNLSPKPNYNTFVVTQ